MNEFCQWRTNKLKECNDMIVTNELRRLAQAATSGGWYVERGKYVYGCKDVTGGEEEWCPVIACTDDDETNVNFEGNAAFIAAANPAAVSELLDRLEAAEKAVTEAYQRGYETGQEEIAAERDNVAQQLVQSEIGKREISEARDALQVEVGKLKDLEVARCVKINGYIVDNARLVEEVERLRAKIAEMEKQEPVATVIKEGDSRYWMSERLWTFPNGKYPLYAIPGAQSVPDVDALAQLIREIDDKHQLGAGALAERIVEWLAAAPEAKP